MDRAVWVGRVGRLFAGGGRGLWRGWAQRGGVDRGLTM
ncbi:MAG: hypothetical protein AVDCRST_MAG05-2908 [uncultured Rubrobacteraceae bacterium]|uniref:Uncharacterized protein n=1 Tax=uncultured Rubrobacteraceae bacterium TaxID=349277 RepID=A0A6J4SZC8_9ACTN|nr:MAG: hypothetical protein AVDCRST_MAG05-2908 [uncultured Rubrobacteraceae bacterium]